MGSTLPLGAMAFDTEMAYPQRPITLVIGFTPGGTTDSLARLLAKHMSDDLGYKVIVDNKPGAGSNIGAEAVARAAPDGYTLYFSSRPNTIHKTMYGNLKYDFARDLVPIGMVATVPAVIVAGKDAPVRTIPDVVALAKSYPGGMTCASPGVGSTSHLLCELFQQEAQIDMMHVPYRGDQPALADIMTGRVDVQFVTLPSALPHIKAGNLQGIAVMSRIRVPSIPQIPTIEEAGFPDLALDAWFGLMAPTGTPQHVIQRLNHSLNVALSDRDLQASMMQLSYTPPPQPNTSHAFKQLIRGETERWATVLRERNIKPLH
jgi:tripartite-type tricarboxylate transporter receptor subunit TctC